MDSPAKVSGGLPRAFTTDIPVLALLIAAWVTVPLFWAHVVTGLALIAVIGVHLLTRRRMTLRFVYATFLIAATAMAATGLLRWAGVPHDYVWHGGISYLVLGLVSVHMWAVRRRLRARIRPPRRGVRNEH